jgi:hypothetical protein
MQQEHGVVSGIWYSGTGKLSDHQAVCVVLAIASDSIVSELNVCNRDSDSHMCVRESSLLNHNKQILEID